MTVSASHTKVTSFARAHTETAIKTLAGIMTCEEASHSARVAAANSLLDRGWGKPAQPISGDPDNPLHVAVTRIELVGVKPTPPPPF